MATKEELFAAVRLVHEHCKSVEFGCFGCPLNAWCEEEYEKLGGPSPERWPDPEEGGTENDP
ncbi:MAG: hypothetical protein VZQ75_02700 [Candidatus Faecousia sp.]|nr:hypothetical protein [Candidatus Faecousia sp.]